MNPGQNTVLFYFVVRMILRPGPLRLWWHTSSNVGHELASKMNWQRGLGRAPLPAVVICCPRKFPYLSHGGIFWFQPPPPQKKKTIPLEIPVLLCLIHVLSFKKFGFETLPTPFPFGISNDPPRSGYGYFLELHNIQCNLQLQLYVTVCTHYSEPTVYWQYNHRSIHVSDQIDVLVARYVQWN